MTEVLALVFVISGFLVGLLGCGVIAWLVSAVIWHYFPNCAYIKWIKAEVFQEEPSFKSEQQDWIAKRMNKRDAGLAEGE